MRRAWLNKQRLFCTTHLLKCEYILPRLATLWKTLHRLCVLPKCLLDDEMPSVCSDAICTESDLLCRCHPFPQREACWAEGFACVSV